MRIHRLFHAALAGLTVSLFFAGCGPSEEELAMQAKVTQLAQKVETLNRELNAAKQEAADARLAAEKQMGDQLASIATRTKKMEDFNEALFGKFNIETGKLGEAIDATGVKLQQMEFFFSKQFENVEGQIGAVSDAQKSREKDIEDLRAQMKKVLEQENRPPRLVRSAPPVYPRRLRNAGTEGEVEVSFVVNMAGDVSDAKVLRSSDKGFEEAAVEAVEKWKFNPALQNGRPVNAYVSQVISFKMRKDKD